MAGFNAKTVSLLGTFWANSAPLGKNSQPSRPLVPICPVEADLTNARASCADVAVVAPTVPGSPPGGVNAAWHAAGWPATSGCCWQGEPVPRRAFPSTRAWCKSSSQPSLTQIVRQNTSEISVPFQTRLEVSSKFKSSLRSGTACSASSGW